MTDFPNSLNRVPTAASAMRPPVTQYLAAGALARGLYAREEVVGKLAAETKPETMSGASCRSQT